MMMVVGGWVGWGGWVVCIELWPRAMQNAIQMATLCCWTRFDITPGCVAPWPGHHLALWCVPDCHRETAVGCALLTTSQGSSWLDHPCQAATRAPPKWVCWLAQFVLATSGLGHHAKLPPEIPAKMVLPCPVCFRNWVLLNTLKGASSFS